MPWRVSFRFAQTTAKLGGWTENFWHQSETLLDVRNAVTNLRPLLLAVHGRTVVNTSYRYTYTPPAGSPPIFRQGLSISTGEANNPQVTTGSDTDYPTTALLLVQRSSPRYQIAQWIKGIPDDQVGGGGFYQPTTTYKRKVDALLGYLCSSAGWGLRVQNKTIEPKRITSISNTGVVTVPSHGYAQGDRVRIKGVTSYKPVNKIWNISVDPGDPNTFQLNFWTTPPSGTVFTGNNPVVIKQSAVVVSPDPTSNIPPGAEIVRATSHKIGRPFDQLSGRRTSRKK